MDIHAMGGIVRTELVRSIDGFTLNRCFNVGCIGRVKLVKAYKILIINRKFIRNIITLLLLGYLYKG